MSTAEPTPPSKKRRRTGWRWAVNLVLILAIFLVIHSWRTHPMAQGAAPPLEGELVHGGRLDLGQFRGEPVLVHFWATWCPVCRMGDQDIDAIAEDFHVVSVAMQSGGSREISSYMGAEGLDFPVVLDEHGHLASDWGVPGVPASFVVDREGQIRSSTLGYTTEIGLRARLWAAQ